MDGTAPDIPLQLNYVTVVQKSFFRIARSLFVRVCLSAPRWPFVATTRRNGSACGSLRMIALARGVAKKATHRSP